MSYSKVVLALLLMFPWTAVQAEVAGPYWSSELADNRFDPAETRRGMLVFAEVCSGCHGLQRVRYNDLQNLGISLDSIEELANDNDADLDDPISAAFEDEDMARQANGGVVPPDLSTILVDTTPTELFLFLTGFGNAPRGFVLAKDRHYNSAVSDGTTAMAPPFLGITVELPGAAATPEQMARDVVAFLGWAQFETAPAPAALASIPKTVWLGIATLILGVIALLLLRPLQKKRSVDRVNVAWNTRWACDDSNGAGKIFDITPYGLFFRPQATLALSPGTRLSVAFVPPGEETVTLSASGTVRWRGKSRRHGCAGLGVEFDRPQRGIAALIGPAI